MRLEGGTYDNEGRVEIFVNGQWGTVCDDGWTITNSDVVCRELGFIGAITYYTGAYFGSGNAKILMDDVDCSGNEGRLRDCHFAGWNQHNCDRSEVVGIACGGKIRYFTQ